MFVFILLSFLIVGFNVWFIFINFKILQSLLIVVPVILVIALFTLLERKVLGAIQRRRGPNVVGRWGLLQPIADALKLIAKETIVPSIANSVVFVVAPVMTFLFSFMNWSLIPFDYGVVYADINLGLMLIFAFSSLGVYGVILSGWASNSKYALLGGVRSTAQMIAYEVSLGLILMIVILVTGTANLTSLVEAQENVWYIFILYPVFLLYFIIALAETNRVPFDLPEAESELVSGYNVEYSAIGFALFFLAEYSSILIMSCIMTIFFLGGWLPFSVVGFDMPDWPGFVWFSLKVCLCVFLFILVRGTLPRYRYDQLMFLGWKVILPITLALYLLVAVILKFLVVIWDIFTLNEFTRLWNMDGGNWIKYLVIILFIYLERKFFIKFFNLIGRLLKYFGEKTVWEIKDDFLLLKYYDKKALPSYLLRVHVKKRYLKLKAYVLKKLKSIKDFVMLFFTPM